MRKTLFTFVVLAAIPAMVMAWPQPGDPAPDFTLPDSAGTSHQLTDYAGKVVMLNFWYAG